MSAIPSEQVRESRYFGFALAPRARIFTRSLWSLHRGGETGAYGVAIPLL